jgi:hypothetical protein
VAGTTGTLSVVRGGTGATDAATARTNLGVTATGADTTYAFRANNLSDLASVATARTNLGVTATGADTTYAFRANNLSDLASVATARTNLGLGTIATQNANSVTVTGGSVNGTTIGATTASTVASTNLSYTGTLTGGTGVVNLGSGQFYKDASGNVGIGTSSPVAKLDVTGAFGTSTTALSILNSSGASANNIARIDFRLANTFSAIEPCAAITGTNPNAAGNNGGALLFSVAANGTNTVPTERMRIDSSGNVGIGTSSPSAKLDVQGASGLLAQFLETTSGSSRRIRFSNSGVVNTIESTTASGSTSLAIAVDGAERMRIASSGNIGIGRTASGENAASGTGFGFASASTNPFFSVVNTTTNTNSCIYLNKRATGGLIIFLTNNGATDSDVGSISHNGTAVAYNTSSDYRLKEDWQPMTGASERVKALKPVNFAWKTNGSRVDGFLAHEAQEVVPEAVHGTKDAVDAEGKPNYQGIDQSKLVPLLTAALQEALTKIDALTARIEALESV